MSNINTPVKVQELRRLLYESNYDIRETTYLVNGFSDGFDLGYEGPERRQDRSSNIPFRNGIASHAELWSKMVKEVDAGPFVGPFDQIPYEYFVQSLIRLVPKANGQTRLIFHLSYNFKGTHTSINSFIPTHKCTVKYRDLDHALLQCLELIGLDKDSCIYFGICDLKSAFCMAPFKEKCWKYFTRMHSSRMRTARSLAVSHCIRKTEKTTHAPPNKTMHAPPNKTTHAPPNKTMHAPRIKPRMPPE